MDAQVTDPRGTAPRRPRLAAVVAALSVLVIVFSILVPPLELLAKADLVGYAICHRLPERSFIIGGRQLPLCARCTGTFLGAVLGLTVMVLLGRNRASRLPPAAVLLALVAFVGFWGFDGLNSYMTLFPNGPHLYEPRNWLRLTTGLLNGLALIIFVYPIFNFTLWRTATGERVIRNIWELIAILPVVALLVFVIQAEIDFLLYPLATLSSLGVLVMLVLINSMVVAVLLGREGYAQSWSQLWLPLTAGAAVAILEISAMVLLRDYLTASLGLPF